MPAGLEMETDILYKSLEAPYGLAVKVSDVQLARGRFTEARRIAADAKLADVQIKASRRDPLGELWIINAPKQETKNG